MNIPNVLFFCLLLANPFFSIGQQARTKADKTTQEIEESIELLEAGLDLEAGLKLYRSTFNTLFAEQKNWQRPIAETEELYRGFEKRRLALLQAFYAIKEQVDALGGDEKKLDTSISKPFKSNKKLLDNLKREEQQATELFKEKMDALLWSLRLEADQKQANETTKKQQKATESLPSVIKKEPAKTSAIQKEPPLQVTPELQAANQALLDKYAAQVKKQHQTINKLMAMNTRLLSNQKKAEALRTTLANNQISFDSLPNEEVPPSGPVLESTDNNILYFQLFFLTALALLGFLAIYLMLRRNSGRNSNTSLTIDMATYIAAILENLKTNSPQHIDVKAEVDSLSFSGETPALIGILLRELVVNAQQYAFQGIEKPCLWISLRRIEGNQIRLIVEDNGVGMPLGFDLTKSKGLGLRVVQKFLRKNLNGQLDIFSSPSEGTQFVLTFVG